MPRAAVNALDPDAGCSFAHRDAVVSCLYGGTGDGHVTGLLDVDAVGVGAIAWRSDLESLERDVPAGEDQNVEHLAVQR